MFQNDRSSREYRFVERKSYHSGAINSAVLATIVTTGVVAVVVIGTAVSLTTSSVGKRLSGYLLDIAPPAPVTVKSGDTVELAAKVASIVDEPVTIVGCVLPCGCLEVGPLPMTIAAGEKVDFRIVFDSSGRKPGRKELPLVLMLDKKSPKLEIPVVVTVTE